MSSVWGNSGQVCTAGTRTLVQRGIYDDFVAAVVRDSSNLRVGSAFNDASDLGPLISREQWTKVQRYVDIGVEQGANLALGGRTPQADGFFQEPTIFTDVRNDMTIAQEEIFGPVMSVIPFDTEEEAYAIANDTQYGLAAGVWTNDLSCAHRAADALARRHRLGQHLPGGQPGGLLRRLEAVRIRPLARRGLPARFHPSQERLDGDQVMSTPPVLLPNALRCAGGKA